MASSTRGPAGFWDDEEARTTTTTGGVPSRPPKPASSPIKDDWEDDDPSSEDEAPTEERNKQIWEDANTKAHHPMPDVILSRNASLPAPTAHIPPQGVFDQLPKMKILKRPSSSSPSTLPSSTSADAANALGSIEERQSRYNEARERIFGAGASGKPKSPGAKEDLNTAQVKVAREPRGPSGEVGGGALAQAPAKGFARRKPKPQAQLASPEDNSR
ncbi:hypothetical protein DFP72DRAFT_473022 [Ephemerocybe angulata]|uniref:SUZ domain-containing protein n=1 Tax=Ephemerocybe angulata TaxID=980116 RepID=A0A8H6M267_9AGAR|nr:hypothetical protein DFP72DRAFT_473022 [Tulosesus angulatus]